MKNFALLFVLSLLGSMGVLAAPVEQHSTKSPKDVFSSFISVMHFRPTHSKHHNSSRTTSAKQHPVHIKSHTAEEQYVKTKTETQIITEECSSDEMIRTTIVEMVPSTRVLEVTPSYIKTKTVMQTVLHDVTETVSSKSRRPKHTKHTWTETDISPSPSPTTSKSSKKHTRSLKKHTRSKTTGSSSASSSVAPSTKKEVVVTTSEVVEVVTVGYTEVVSTMTLSEGDSRLSSMTRTSSTGSSSTAYSIDRPSYPTWFPTGPWPTVITFSADAVVGETKDIATSDASPLSTSFRTIYPNATAKTQVTTPAELPSTKSQGAGDVVENLSARDDEDDPEYYYTKYRKPDKAMSKRMSRWSKHHNIQMEKQSSYKQKAHGRAYDKSIRKADKASKKKHYNHNDDQVASAGLPARDVTMAAPATADAVVTVTTTVVPTQNGTYSTSWRTVHASKTGSVESASNSKASKTHSKSSSKASSKASNTSSGSSSKITSQSALEIDVDAMTGSKYWPLTCTWFPCWVSEGPAPTQTALETEDATMSTMVAGEESNPYSRWNCMNHECRSRLSSADVTSTVKTSTSKASSTSTDSLDAAVSSGLSGISPLETLHAAQHEV